MKFFWKPANGLKADIERHRKEEMELIEKMRNIDTSTDIGWSSYRAYSYFLSQLQQSKADVVTQLGRNGWKRK